MSDKPTPTDLLATLAHVLRKRHEFFVLLGGVEGGEALLLVVGHERAA